MLDASAPFFQNYFMNGISVIVCTHNGAQRLPATLNHIVELQSNLPWELIVVDNASTDDTTSVCDNILANQSRFTNWKLVEEKKPGLNSARLRGLREAQFEYVLFCDDDNGLSENYLILGQEIISANPQIGALGGCGIPQFETGKPAWFDKYSHSFAVGPQAAEDGKLSGLAAELYGAGTFFRKEPLLGFFYKGFSTVMSDRKGKTLASGGDVEWCYLIQLAGYELWYDHRLTFLHSMPEGRMQWSYYLRLKQGIALGGSNLLPYECLLKNPDTGTLSFGLHWCYRTLFATLVFIKQQAKLLFKPANGKAEDELAQLIIKAKMNSYWQNGLNAFRHFRHLKSKI